MKVTPWKHVRSRASKLDIELARIREFAGIYGLGRPAINVVEGHPKRPEPFWQVSIDEWCCHIVKKPGCITVSLTWAGEGIWKGPVATSDIAGVVLGSLRTAIKVEERRDDVLEAVARRAAEAFAGELGEGTTELPEITCESDWLDLDDGDRGRLTGKLNSDLKPGDDSLAVSTVDWDLLLATIPDGYQGPVIKAGTPVEAVVTRTEDGMETTTADIKTRSPASGERKFYRHTYEVVVLSESPEEADLSTLYADVTDGDDCLSSCGIAKTDELTGKEAVAALRAAGSDESFFGLTEEGEPA